MFYSIGPTVYHFTAFSKTPAKREDKTVIPVSLDTGITVVLDNAVKWEAHALGTRNSRTSNGLMIINCTCTHTNG